MVLKVGINGFGRVGRVVFRTCLEHPDVEVCAINDPAIEVDYICYLIKYDSTHGTLKGDISHTDNEIKINDLFVKVYQEKFPAGIPWHAAGVQYVVEASGMFTSLVKASGHLICDGVKRVIVTAPCIDVPMVIFGVNEKKIKSDNKVISCGSSTLYCLAPIVKVLEDKYGVEEGFITSIHAMTPSLKPLDGLCLKGKHWRDHRSITQNIIPAATGACRALGRLIPAVRDRVCGLAFRVPIANVSVLDLTVRLKKFTSIENIAQDVEKFNETTKNIMKVNTEQAVSSDFIGDSYSCILDIGSSIQLKPDSFKLICWYENEYSYACRVVDLILYSETQCKCESRTQSTYVCTKTSHKLDAQQQTDAVRKERSAKAKIKTEDLTKGPAHLKLPAAVSVQRFGSSPEGRMTLGKIWNDEVPTIRHNPTAFFQGLPSLPYAPTNYQSVCVIAQERLEKVKQGSICTKAQERLDKMKQEFSKMVNITETLLKKSYTSNQNLNFLEETNNLLRNSNSIDINATVKSFKDTDTSSDTPKNTSTNGIMSSTILNRNNDVDGLTVQQSGNNLFEKDEFDCNKISESMKEAENTDNERVETAPQDLNTRKSLIAKIFTDLFVGQYKLQFTNIKHDTVDEKDKEKITEIGVCEKSVDRGVKNNKAEANDELPQTNIIDEQIVLLKALDIENVLINNTNDVIQNNDEHLEPNSCNDENSEHMWNFSDIEAEQKQTDNTKKMEDIHVDQRCGDYVRTVERADSKQDDVQIEASAYTDEPKPDSGLGSAPSSPRTRCRQKKDIFDKLDSASSESGSNNSFEICNKKSEIINITDLTTSLEDLDRLDKICRIMEISDDLSDKLFSALNKTSAANGNENVAKKRWSFKDLCEKVNLDEFCNKVFGK